MSIPRLMCVHHSTFAVFAAACAGLLQSVAGQTILETCNDSLTTYLAGASSWQGVTPRADQRAVQLDGTLRVSPMWAAAIAGNPWGDGAPGRGRLADIRLDNGTYSPTEMDIALPSKGIPWVIGRSYNIRQGSASNGPQGRNWFQSSRPEIKLYTGATKDKDIIYIVFGADRYIELQRTGNHSSDPFKAKNGAAGVVEQVSSIPETYIYSDQNGNQFTFLGSTGVASADWQLWKAVDPAGNVSYVGHATNVTTAVSSGFGTPGVTTAYDATGRRYTYSYTKIDSTFRLTSVKAELNVSGTWTEVGKVDYDYYASTDTDLANGDPGNLRLVTTTTPLTPSGTSLVRKTYYRYDTTTDAVTYVVGPEGTRALTSYQAASSSTLKPYTTAYFEYDGSVRINKAFFNGECGCSGGNNGEYLFTYDANPGFSGTAGYDTAWANRTVIQQPDSVYQVRYFDETGQPLSSVLMAGNPASYSGNQWWATEWVRNSSGQTTAIYSPASISAYAHDVATVPTGSFTRQGSAGLVTKIGRVSSGNMAGFVEKTGYQEGNSPSTYSLTGYSIYSGQSFTPVSGATVVRPHVTETRAYHTATDQASPNTTANYDATVYAYTFHSATASSQQVVAFKSITTTAPTVSAGNNGSGSATSTVSYLRTDGTAAFTKTALGIYSYTLYEDGLMTKSVADVDATSGVVDASDSPSAIWGWSLPTAGTGERLTAAYAFDRQGRSSTVTLPTGRVTKTVYTRLSDHRPVIISIPRFASGNWYGPLSYTAMNQAGRGVFSGVVALSSPVSDGTAVVDTTASDPVTALLVGTLSRVKGSFYTPDGAKLVYTRLYTTLPSTMAASSGFDETAYTYDDNGRPIRTIDPTGTISRTVYNTRGMTIERSIGTNDNGLVGGSSSGASDMTTVEKLEYDGGNSNGQGNGNRTKRTADADGNWGVTTDQRVTQWTYDFRNRMVVEQSPASPHALQLYDNLGRVTAMGHYSSVSGLTVTSSPIATSTNRIGLEQYFFNEAGRRWKILGHEVVQSTGSLGSSVAAMAWHDPDGRLVKTAGAELTKTTYDRVGRAIARYVLASTDDGGSYSAALTPAGDAVLEETHHTYQPGTGLAVMTTTLRRASNSDFWVAGPLDTNSDNDNAVVSGADVFGRLSIVTAYYDSLDRLETYANYGTFAIAADGTSTSTNFNRLSITTAPTYLTSGVIVAKKVYNDDGLLKDVVDSKGHVQRTLFDTAGRQVSRIANYTDGTVGGGANNDEDQVTETAYLTGNRIGTVTRKMTGSGNDEVTTYTYGVQKASSASPLVDSDIASNQLLASVSYPEQSSGQAAADRSTYCAYNALGETRWTRDPSGNIIETTFDAKGRTTVRSATTIVSPFDSTVVSVHHAYNAKGFLSSASQKNSGGTVLNEIVNGYDDWGNLASFEQDPDSAVGAGTGRASYKTTATYTLFTPSAIDDGRQTVRRSAYTFPDGSTNGQSVDLSYDAENTHVIGMTMNSVNLATYEYTGMNQNGTLSLDELQMVLRTSDSGMANYNHIDRWDRPVYVQWIREDPGFTAPPVLVSLQLSYDEMGAPKYQKDFTAKKTLSDRSFDRVNTYDGLRRLIRVDEGEANSGGTLITPTKEARAQIWTLDILGRATNDKVDLNGNTTYTNGTIPAKDAGEMDDTRTFNKRNRPTGRSYYDKDNLLTPAAVAMTFDKNDNLLSDGDKYDYVYNVWCQLVAVKLTGTATYVAKFTYNAIGQRISEQYDTNRSANDGQPDGAVDSNDPVFYTATDPSGFHVATFRGSDTYPKETFVYHAGGAGPLFKRGVLLRDRDADLSDPAKWAIGAAPSKRAERTYYIADHLGSVLATLDDQAAQREHYRYSATGVPTGVPAGDLDWSGDVDASGAVKPDKDLWDTIRTNYLANNITGYDVRADLNMDGAVDSADSAILTGVQDGKVNGRGVLSEPGVESRVGWRGRKHDKLLLTWTAAKAKVPSISNLQMVAMCVGVATAEDDDWRFPDPNFPWVPAPMPFYVHGNWCGGNYGGVMWNGCKDEKGPPSPARQKCGPNDDQWQRPDTPNPEPWQWICPVVDCTDACCKRHDLCMSAACIDHGWITRNQCQAICDGSMCSCMDECERKESRPGENWARFWMRLLFCTGIGDPNGNATNRDFNVQCCNNGKDTKYQPIPEDRPELIPWGAPDAPWQPGPYTPQRRDPDPFGPNRRPTPGDPGRCVDICPPKPGMCPTIGICPNGPSSSSCGKSR